MAICFKPSVQLFSQYQGQEATEVYITSGTFLVYDPNRPDWWNWLVDKLGIDLESMWWIVVAGLLILVWVLAGRQRKPYIGVIGSALIFIALIVFGIVSPWVVVLVAILAGFIIWKMFTGRHGGE